MTRIVTRIAPWQVVETLCQSGIHPVLARIYAARGLSHMHELTTDLGALHAPSGLLHITSAARFLADVIQVRKKCVIVADYDCDGATACAVGLRGLRLLGAEVDFIVPNRFEYGYGLTPEIVDLALRETSPQVIITVDNGIASVDGVMHANACGVEVVITDHHLPGDQLPNARVIVNPNQMNCGFPSKHLAGVGVMFYVLLALRSELRQRGIFTAENQPRLDGLLDLVALGTVADVVKLDTNNRILVMQGLKRMRAQRMQPGIAALFRVAGREARKATTFDLGFALGPRLNAAGRLADMSLGIECLVTDAHERAHQIAEQLDVMNQERRTLESEMQDTALSMVDTLLGDSVLRDQVQKNFSLSLFHQDWHPGVIGIVASRLKERFYRPTIIFAPNTQNIDLLQGSGRAISGFHLRDALDLVSKRLPGVIEKFGGHAMAAGLTIRANQFECFTETFEEVTRHYLQTLGKNGFERVFETDGSLEDAYYTIDFVRLIEQQIWGQGFSPPLFCDEFSVTHQRLLKEKHLKLTLQKGQQCFDAIWFGHTEDLGQRAKVVFRLDVNEFNKMTKLQLIVEYAQRL